jgi:hypothetical protein
MKISIVTICYNRAFDIEKTIKSVVNQIFEDIQYIIIDGGSTDGTLDVINKYKGKIDKIVSEKDHGVYDAMNKGLALATGDYVLFMNGGDSLYDQNVLIDLFSKAPEVDLIYGECMLVDEHGTEIMLRSKSVNRPVPQSISKYTFLYGTNISHQSFIIRRSLTRSFDQQYKISADVDWMIDTMSKCKSSYLYPRPISQFLTEGLSSTQQKKGLEERFKIFRSHFGLIATSYAHVVILVKKVGNKIFG